MDFKRNSQEHIIWWDRKWKNILHRGECFVYRNGERIIISIVHSVKAEISTCLQLRGQYLSNWWLGAWEFELKKEMLFQNFH